jgi:hypothetical protein
VENEADAKGLLGAGRNAFEIEVIGGAQSRARDSEQGRHEQTEQAPKDDGRDPAPSNARRMGVVNEGQTRTCHSKRGALEIPSILGPARSRRSLSGRI